MSLDERWARVTAESTPRPEPVMGHADAIGEAHDGWEAGRASRACVHAWQQRLRELADRAAGES